MVSSVLQNAIASAIRKQLAPQPVTDVEVTEGKNSSEDDALFVTIHLPRDAALLPGERLLAAMAAVSDAVVDTGDSRFPYVRTLRVGEERPDDRDAVQH